MREFENVLAVKDVHRSFSGSIPENYERYLVPFLFAPFARDLADRSRLAPDATVLELACGTGAVTQRLAERLDERGKIVATDLNQDMMDRAHKKLGTDRRISWQQADATALPFGDGNFDAVICQFGWMFFPDRQQAVREAKRVLRPSGRLVFNTWDSIAENPVPAEVYAAIRARFPTNPPSFYDVPFGMFDPAEHERIARAAGFDEVKIERVRLEGAKLSPADAAMGLIRGGPFISEIEQRGTDASSIIDDVAGRLRSRFGAQPFAARLSALVCSATRS